MFRTMLLLTAVLAFISSGFTGCSLIGFTAGIISENRKATIEFADRQKMENIKPGTPVKIRLREKQAIQGIFRGWAAADSLDYSRRYLAFRTVPEYRDLFPALKDTIYLCAFQDSSGRRFEGWYLFSGFDFNSIRLQVLPGNAPVINRMDNILNMTDAQGKKINAQLINMRLHEGKVPVYSDLLLQGGDHDLKISGENIQQIHTPTGTTAALVYGLIGAGLDVLAIWLMARDMNLSSSFRSNW